MFNVPISTITKGSVLRDKSKISELALGYEGSLTGLWYLTASFDASSISFHISTIAGFAERHLRTRLIISV